MTRPNLQALRMGAFRLLGKPAPTPGKDEPIPMVLHCPRCGRQHIDAPELWGWNNPPHRSHLCHNCGHVWRPADVATTGVAEIQTRGRNDSPPARVRPFTNGMAVIAMCLVGLSGLAVGAGLVGLAWWVLG